MLTDLEQDERREKLGARFLPSQKLQRMATGKTVASSEWQLANA